MSEPHSASGAPHDPRPEGRRPIATRGAGWAKSLAGGLARWGASPNQISMSSGVCAAAGAACAAWGAFPGALVCAALMVQARLVCNLLDGMVAIEGGKATATGALYNEFPDRVSDSLLLAGAGVLAGSPELGLLAALCAMGTAYVRAYGGALGLPQSFAGPLAKQQRMALLTIALIAGEACRRVGSPGLASSGMAWTLWAIAAGSGLTCARRAMAIGRALKAREPGATDRR